MSLPNRSAPPYWSNPPFLISDIRALWRSVLSARAPECQKLKNGGFDQYGAGRFEVLASLGFNGLNLRQAADWSSRRDAGDTLRLPVCCVHVEFVAVLRLRP